MYSFVFSPFIADVIVLMCSNSDDKCQSNRNSGGIYVICDPLLFAVGVE